MAKVSNPLGNYVPRLQPMSHQLDALRACDNKPPAPCADDAFAYLADMGTGKSCIQLNDWARGCISGGAPDLLLIAPAGSYRNWFTDKGEDPGDWSEIRKHLSRDLFSRLLWAPWISGKAKSGPLRQLIMNMMRHHDPKRPRALFVNVEALSTKTTGARELVEEFVKQRGAMVAIDESTTIKNASAERTEFIIKVGAQAAARRILSGLWTPSSPLDLYAQCAFLSPKILGMRNEWAFKSRYAIMKRRNVVIPGQFNRDGSVKTRSFQQIVDWRLTEELQNKVKPYSYRIRAEDCLDLPEKSYHPRYVPLTPDQKRMIKEMKLFGHAAIGGTDKFVTIDAVIKMITRRLQINCGYVMDDERVLQEVPENRTNALMELLADYAGKAIIWVPWHPPLKKVLDRITKEYGPDSVAQWHGGNRATRHEDERRFLNDPNCRFMVATQGAGMRGNTWTVAGVAIYYANNYDLEQRDQSERRNWRIGQKNTVRYYDLIAEDDDIDMKVLKNLRAKISVATMMNQEDFRKWLI